MADHLFIVDPLARLNLKLDSSLRMMRALAAEGEDVWWAEADQLAWCSRDQSPRARVRRARFVGDAPEGAVREGATRALSAFASIHMRKDPPFDMDYVAATWILSGVKDHGVRIFNRPEALRTYNEKLSTFLFPDWCAPTLVSASLEEILVFSMQEGQGDVVVKPLDLYGGRGVVRLELTPMSESERRRSLVEALGTGGSPRLVQPFDRAVLDGEVRCFAVGAEIFVYCLKKPRPGTFLANTAHGASLLPWRPTPTQRLRIERAAGELKVRGIDFVGFDMIGDRLSEINITSPRLLLPEGAPDPYPDIARWIKRAVA